MSQVIGGVTSYDGPAQLNPGRLLTLFAVDPWLAAGLLLAALAYFAGVIRLSRRGDRWPVGRTVAWCGGLLLIAYATMGGLAAYDDVLFSAHMAQHMILNMVAPVPLALGAPVTLALRTLRQRSLVRRALLGVLHSRVARVLTFPPVGFVLFVTSTFALYFTSLYPDSLTNVWLHRAIHVHFIVVGCLFFWPLLGLDPLPGRLPHWGRMVTLFLALPFHAFLGLAIMTDTAVIAGPYYRALARPWGASLLSDQYTGGSILWASGDLVGLAVFAVVFIQWSRADERLATREDRRLDRLAEQAQRGPASGQDADGHAETARRQAAADAAEAAALADYNARLAALADGQR